MDLHPVQIKILKALLFKPLSRFRDLNQTDLTSDHFSFHIKKLLETNLIHKVPGGYVLTAKGMEIAGRIDTTTGELVLQPKLGVAICLIRDNQVLLNRRKKDQAINMVGLHTEKVRLGEKLIDTVARCVAKEIGQIEYDLEFAGISHVLSTQADKIDLDVVLHCFRLDYVSGEVSDSTPEGENMWISLAAVDSLPDLMPGIKQVLESCFAHQIFFTE